MLFDERTVAVTGERFRTEDEKMNDQGTTSDRDGQAPASDSASHTPDFSAFTAEQLREELLRRQASAYPGSAPYTIPVRLAPVPGLRGLLANGGANAGLFGEGRLELEGEDLALYGWRVSWLGAPVQAVIRVPLASIRNVVQQSHLVRFEVARGRRMRQFRVWTEAPEAAQEIAVRLPTTTTE